MYVSDLRQQNYFDDSSFHRSGFYMSELLYLYGELGRRVRPLVFTVRRWAKDQGLIQDLRPTPSFTNFSMTLLVLFFLQKKYKMLPPLRDLQQLARKGKFSCAIRLRFRDLLSCDFITLVHTFYKTNSMYVF